MFLTEYMVPVIMSPSARRAWIEILFLAKIFVLAGSPSARRAWIEIRKQRFPRSAESVALRKEGVDRNFLLISSTKRSTGRPPQGGRG